MFAGRGHASPRGPQVPLHPTVGLKLKNPHHIAARAQVAKKPPVRPEPDYEVVEFPSEQYVNAKIQTPLPPPPRLPSGASVVAGAACGLCGGGGARVRCTECGRQALCASCDDMYHRHPKRRNHQRQALPSSPSVREERPPLPPKSTPPVPPPRRHKISSDRSTASPRPSLSSERRTTLGTLGPAQRPPAAAPPRPAHPALLGSTPYLPSHHLATPPPLHTNTMGYPPHAWNMPPAGFPGLNFQTNQIWSEQWRASDPTCPPSGQGWARPLRRGASVLELSGGGGGGGGPVNGAAHGCSCGAGWRYGSCASLDHGWPHCPSPCCGHHTQPPPAHTYRRDSRPSSRAASRGVSRAVSPAHSVRSRASRRAKYRSPTPSLPSSDADSESECAPPAPGATATPPAPAEESLGPPPPPPSTPWPCEHCTFVNEPGVGVCAVCCRTPTAEPHPLLDQLPDAVDRIKINGSNGTSSGKQHKQNGVITATKSSTAQSRPSSRLQGQKSNQSNTLNSTRNSKSEQRAPTIKTESLYQGKEEAKAVNINRDVQKHSVSVGPSPPRDSPPPAYPAPATATSPAPSSAHRRSTATSPPPQTIATQTYEDPRGWEHGEARGRRRVRDAPPSDRSHSRLSGSSDARESDQASTGRCDWRSSPAGEWRGLRRRSSLLDVGRRGPLRSSAASPEPRAATRAISMEALSAAPRRDQDAALHLAKLLAEAQKLGYGAEEVQVALVAGGSAPLRWLSSRWPALVSGARAAAERLVPGAAVSEREARAALLRRGAALWPAVSDIVEQLRTQAAEGQHGGAVWGEPAGADDDAAPPLRGDYRADDDSDDYDAGPPLTYYDDEPFADDLYSEKFGDDRDLNDEIWEDRISLSGDVVRQLSSLMDETNIAAIEKTFTSNDENDNVEESYYLKNNSLQEQHSFLDLGQSENDFIDAYNALNKLKPINNTDQSQITPRNLQQEQIEPSTSSTPSDIKNEQKDLLNKQFVINSTGLDIGIKNDTTVIKTETKQGKPSNIKPIKEPINAGVLNLINNDASNLNDIVDNTQKLIQQMKDEINSDINSLDDRNSSRHDSLSETSESSQDSPGHETSYEESESSKEVFSDEDSTSEDDQKFQSEIKVLKVNHASSEENDHFEEALDNLDEQIEDFKIANLEVLNSITKSLQEDHTITIEAPATESKIKQNVNSDSNNFMTVETFEEIYEELGSISTPAAATTRTVNTHNNSNPNYSSPNQTQSTNENTPPLQTQINPHNLIKHEISVIQHELVTATIPQIDEINLTPLNAQVETIIEITNVESKTDSVITEESQDSADSTNSNKEDTTEPIKTDMSNVENMISTQNQTTVDISEPDSSTKVSNTESLNNDQPLRSEQSKDKQPSRSVSKSNIPKPIKAFQKIKQQLDKGLSKVVVSKVPVRRTSMKPQSALINSKSHFRNVHSGHVKHIQTRLFSKSSITTEPQTNSSNIERPTTKEAPSEVLSQVPSDKADAVPSTSTAEIPLAAPSTDMNQEASEGDTARSTAAVRKKPYFRETCRTEDEWTDSESDTSQEPPPRRAASPAPPAARPPPLTLRRVSGQYVDLATVRLPEGSPERQARLLLAEGAAESWAGARLAVELAARGTELPAALLAALDCKDLDAALTYLAQECDLCAGRVAEHEMVSLLRCTHRCCRECARLYFTVQISERSIVDCVCPYCKEPELEAMQEDEWLEYFAHLDIFLKTLLDTDVHELFQRKLRDRTLAKDPNFRWCVECSSGFFVHPKHKKLRCPECKSVTCATCRKPWSQNHEGLSCEQYLSWLEDNDPERSLVAVHQHLRDNGIECPRCHFKYSLSRGGCMHFTCTQCKYEFCFGCGKPFMMSARCGLSEYCAKLGLHAHHPRNCLFYLRDKEPHELQTLLQMNNVPFEVSAPTGGGSRCPLQLQRETPAGLVDGQCGADVPPNHAGLCKPHYVEYLAGLARRLDPLPVMALPELVAELRRRALPLPERGPWDSDPIYAGMCAQIVKEKIPLD